MKTQLLEDIGQSATVSLVPSGRASNAGSRKGGQDVAQAPAATPVRPRSAFGVWRQKPEGEPVALATQQPDHPPPPLEAPPPPLYKAPIAPAEPALAAKATQGPVFDFTPPTHPTPALDLDKRAPTWFERSGRRYLLWGSCVLSLALAVQAGRWLYEERKDVAALAPAPVADESKAEPQLNKAVKRRAIRAKEFTLGPDGEVLVAPAAAPSPLPRTAPIALPLVLLEPEPAADNKDQPTAALKAAKKSTAAPVPKRMQRTERERLVLASKPARAGVKPAMQVEKNPEPESAMSATLKACRELGYHAAQCVKRACRVTKYGLVCRGK